VQQVLVYSDSLSWGIVPTTRRRLPFDARWPGVMEIALTNQGHAVRIIEDCLNGRRTVWDDPFKPGRNGLVGLEQRIEVNSPLSLVMLMLGTNDFQSMHPHSAWHAAPPPILIPKGPIAPKFTGAGDKSVGLAEAYRAIATELACLYFDAASVIAASPADGIHLDADQHQRLGRALAAFVAALPGFALLPQP
jgi:lysophospholipase L1-like esterase